jgi:hypothetical protein
MGTDLVPTPCVPPSRCPECGALNDAASVIGELYARPHSGDASICAYCRHVAVFNEDLTLREPSIDELLKFARDARVTVALKVLAKNPFKPE